MDIIENSQERIDQLNEDVSTIRSEMNRRLAVVSNQLEYSMDCIERATQAKRATKDSNSACVLLCDNAVGGTYEKFGVCLMPPAVSTPVNVFNLQTSTGPIYKNNAQIFINGAVQPGYSDILMHDAISGKHAVFEEFDDSDITLEVRVNPNDLLGATSFNCIELLPFLPGSFNVTKMELYTMQDYRTNEELPSYTREIALNNVGVGRIVFPETRSLYRCIFHIHLNYMNNAGKFPFGLKHVYFLMGNYSAKSNVTVKVTTDDYIDFIGDDIILEGQDGKEEVSCESYGIQLYLSNENGVLSDKIKTSKGLLHNMLPRNVKTFYASIPLKVALSSIKFKNISLR